MCSMAFATTSKITSAARSRSGRQTTDVFDVTGRPAEDFETIARRYAAQPRNQRTFGNWLRELVQFMLAPLGPGFGLDPDAAMAAKEYLRQQFRRQVSLLSFMDCFRVIAWLALAAVPLLLFVRRFSQPERRPHLIEDDALLAPAGH
jgi:hypothetical protein